MIAKNYIFGRKYDKSYLENIVAYYKLDSNADDFVGTADGTGINVTYIPGEVDNCADFNGTSSYISIPYSSLFSPTNGMTDIPYSWGFILKRTGDTSTTQTVLGRRDTTVGQEYWIGFTNAGSLDFNIFSQGTSNYIGRRVTAGTLVNGSTYRFIITYDGSGSNNGIKIYIDGSLVSTGPLSSGTYIKCNSINIPTMLGQLNLAGSPTRFMKGTLDEFVFWRDKELTPSEVTAINDLWLNNNPI